MRMLIIFFLLLQFSVPAFATDTAQLENSLPVEAAEIYGQLQADPDTWDEGLGKLMDWIGDKLPQVLSRALKSGAQMLTILVLCAAAKAVSGGKTPDFVTLAGALGIAGVAAGDVGAFIGLGESALRSMMDFCTVLLPCMASAGAAAGNLSSSAAMYAATMLFMDILLALCAGFVMPLIYIYIAAVTARAALGSEVMSAAVNVTKWLCVTTMTVLVTVFTAYFSVTGAIGSAADTAGAKAAKAAIAAALPVVGKIVSGAAGTVVAGASVLRAGIGVFGLLAVLGLCAYPFLALGLHYFVYKCVAMLSGGLADKGLSELIGGIGTAFGMVLSMVGCGAMMLFFTLVAAMKAVSTI